MLVDTCVLSEARHPRGNPRVRQRLEAVPDADLFLSVVTIGEIVSGVARLAAGQRRRDLETWLSQLEQLYAPRILPVDLEAGRIWGEVTAKAAQQGRIVPVADGLIAATALRNGLHVMTRNSADFQAAGVLVVDPWNE
jgi:predicted nucleic acid-binding protein